jgi:WD40 repeat protein/serine/threonine protein kinase/tetratricopeptide (TPR) repeat protein
MPVNLNRARELFIEAVGKLSPDQWDDFLAAKCRQDIELRQHVGHLLRAHVEAGSFLDHPPAAGLGHCLAAHENQAGCQIATVDDPFTERPGTVIGPYKLLEQIGEGGFGVVFMAEQVQPVRRKVALKVLKPGMDTRQVVARFEAERQALAIMDHPNIARVFDGGETASRRPYFVMELVRGVPITEYCDQNHQTPRERLDLFLSVCHAVQHAHQKGIIHRDLKPSNVLVCMHDTTPVVKVIDFGVAKALGQELTEKTLFTGFAQMIGTPMYMSPEQAGQSSLDIDTRSDIYSLGVLLYELLTGTTPFDKERFRRAAHDEIRRIIREEDPPKPSTRLSTIQGLVSIAANRGLEPKKLNGLMRGELDWIVMKALEKDRNRRYETPNGLAMDIQRYLADQPVQACSPSATYRLRKFASRNKAAFATAAGVCAALVALVAVLAVSNMRIRQESMAKEQALRETGQALRDKAVALEAREQALETSRYHESVARDNARRADEQRDVAVEKERLAQANERLARGRYYAAQMNLAVRAWEDGETTRVLDLLETQRPRFLDDDLRSFEWYAMWQLCHQQLRSSLQTTVRAGNREQFVSQCVAYSPDSSMLALGTPDGTVILFDALTGREIRRLQGDRSPTAAIAFSPDGSLLAQAAGTEADKVILWNLDTGSQTHVLNAGIAIQALAFSPNGQKIAAAAHRGPKGAVYLWDIASGLAHDVWQSTKSYGLSFSPDGKWLATTADAGAPGKLTRIWDVSSSRVIRDIAVGGRAVAFSPDGTRLAIGRSGSSVFTLLDTETWQEVPVQKGAWGSGMALGFIPGRNAIAVGLETRSVKVVDLTTGKAKTFPYHSSLHSLAVSPNGELLAAIGTDGTLKTWDLVNEALFNKIDVSGPISALHFSPDGNTLAVGMNRQVNLLDIATGESRRLLRGHSQTIRAMAFSQDSATMAAGSTIWSEPGELKLWNVNTGQEKKLIPEFNSAAHAVAISPDDRVLAVGGPHAELALFNLATGQRMTVVSAHLLTALVYSPDGKLLISAERSGLITLRDPTTGVEQLTFGPSETKAGILALCCSPDGKLLASGNAAGMIHLWELPSGRLHGTLHGNTAAVRSMTFFPDGSTLANANEAGEVKLWDVATGQERVTTRLGSRLAVSADGRMLAVASGSVVRILRASATPEAMAFRSELNSDDPDGPVGQNDGGELLWAAGQLDKAEAAFRNAYDRLLVLVDQAPQVMEYRRELVRSAVNLRAILSSRDVSDSQLDSKIHETFHGLSSDQQLFVARQLLATATLLNQSKRTQDAQKAHRSVVEAISSLPIEKLADPNLREMAISCYVSLVNMLQAERQTSELDYVYRQWIDLLEKLEARNAADTAIKQELAEQYRILANKLWESSDFSNGQAMHRRALGIHVELAAQFPKDATIAEARHKTRYALAFSLIDFARLPAEGELICREDIRQLQDAVAESGETPVLLRQLGESLFGLAWSLQHQQRFADAVEAFRDGAAVRERLVADPDSTAKDRHDLRRTYTGLGTALAATGESNAAIQAYYQSLEQAKKLGELGNMAVYQNGLGAVRLNLARLLRQAGRFDEAEQQYRAAVDFFESHPDKANNRAVALMGLAQALARVGQREEATATYERLLTIKPDSALACNNVAWFLATAPEVQFRDPQRAVELAQRAVDNNTGNQAYWNTLGVAHFRAGNYEAAYAALKKSLSFLKADAYDFLFLAMTDWKLGRETEARAWYDKAIQSMNPTAAQDEELVRFRSEAEELLGLN